MFLKCLNLTNRFKTSYNVDYTQLKKISNQARYALLITSSIDSENYILRRTFWDFLNIAGATVIDPAYKISTYAVLVDTTHMSIDEAIDAMTNIVLNKVGNINGK